jgi:heme/copper-type cytochrome/quinol oxidase subunit 2
MDAIKVNSKYTKWLSKLILISQILCIIFTTLYFVMISLWERPKNVNDTENYAMFTSMVISTTISIIIIIFITWIGFPNEQDILWTYNSDKIKGPDYLDQHPNAYSKLANRITSFDKVNSKWFENHIQDASASVESFHEP